MRLASVFLIAFMWADSLYGQVVQIQATFQICESNQLCQVMTARGSAVNIGRSGDKWLFVSAGHLFHGDNWNNAAAVRILRAHVTIGGAPHPATLKRYFIDSPKALDLSFWEVECNQHDCHPYPLIDKYPSRGAGMQIIGYSSGSSSPRPTTFWEMRDGWVATSHDTRHGDSGGALLYKGNLAGIISGAGIKSDPTPGRHTSAFQILKYTRMYFPAAQVAVHETPVATEPPDRWEPVQEGPDTGADVVESPDTVEPTEPGGNKSPAQDPVAQTPEQRPGDQPVESPSVIGTVLDSPITKIAVGAATGGTGVAALWGVNTLLKLRRKRRKRKRRRQPATFPEPPDREPAMQAECPELPNRDMDEARELTKLGQLEGRDPLLDSLGYVHFEDLRESAPPEDREVLDRYYIKTREYINRVAPISYTTKG